MLFRGVDERIVDVAEDADVLTMGITPSGKGILHQGHYATVLNLLSSLNHYPGQRAKIFVDDREFNTQQPPKLPDEDVTQRIEVGLKGFIARAAAFFHDDTLVGRIDIQRMSDFFRAEGLDSEFLGEDFLNLMIRYRLAIGKFFPKMKISGVNGARALCRNCGFGKVAPSRVKYLQGVLNGQSCENRRCDDYESPMMANIVRGDTNWAIFYTLVGLRDVLMARAASNSAILHVYGGDYGMPWGRSGTPKAERISNLVTAIGDGSGFAKGGISHFVGPLLTIGGHKISKSRGHGGLPEEVDFDSLLAMLESDGHVVEVE